MAHGKAWTENDIEAMLALKHGGATYREISPIVGVSAARVQQLLARAGHVEQGPYRAINVFGILRAHGPEKTLKEISEAGGESLGVTHRVLKAMGLPFTRGRPGTERKYSDEQLLEHLRLLSRELGYTPGLREITSHSPPPHTTYYRRFGSLPEACRLAGLKVYGVGRPGWRSRKTSGPKDAV